MQYRMLTRFGVVFLVVSTLINTMGSDLVSNSNLRLTNDLYSKISESKRSDNIIFSPFSIQVILALAYMGAHGETASQIAFGLHMVDNSTQIKAAFQNNFKTVWSKTQCMANKIFIDKAFNVDEDFAQMAVDCFHSEVKNLDLGSSKAADEINHWVENVTHGNIREIITSTALRSKPELVLVNAIYFKGFWKIPFVKTETEIKPFFVKTELTRDVKMMNVVEKFKLCNNIDLGIDIVEIPYKDNNFCLVIILPVTPGIEVLRNVENRLRKVKLNTILPTEKKLVHISIPKLRLESGPLDLQNILEDLGMFEMWDDMADFSGLTGGRVQVGTMVHKALIELDEESTVAAAATSVVIGYESEEDEEETAEFKADHPFMFFVYSYRTETISFMGRYCQPVDDNKIEPQAAVRTG